MCQLARASCIWSVSQKVGGRMSGCSRSSREADSEGAQKISRLYWFSLLPTPRAVALCLGYPRHDGRSRARFGGVVAVRFGRETLPPLDGHAYTFHAYPEYALAVAVFAAYSPPLAGPQKAARKRVGCGNFEPSRVGGGFFLVEDGSHHDVDRGTDPATAEKRATHLVEQMRLVFEDASWRTGNSTRHFRVARP